MASNYTGEAVSYFIPDGGRKVRTLRSKIEARMVELSNFIAAGVATDYADYKFRVGYIQGMNEVIDMLDQIEKDEK